MNSRRLFFLAAAAFFPTALLPSVSFGEVVLGRVLWQLPRPGKKPARRFLDTQQWLQPVSAKLVARPRVLIALSNSGASAEEAVLVRYAVSARLAPLEGGQDGAWGLPFFVDEIRVPRLRAGTESLLPVRLDRIALDAYLQRMRRAGLWPTALRIQAAVEPRPGAAWEGKTAEQTLSVIWRPAGTGGSR